MHAKVNGDGTVTIKESDFNELILAERLLEALRAQGVDNWDGWDAAVEEANE